MNSQSKLISATWCDELAQELQTEIDREIIEKLSWWYYHSACPHCLIAIQEKPNAAGHYTCPFCNWVGVADAMVEPQITDRCEVRDLCE